MSLRIYLICHHPLILQCRTSTLPLKVFTPCYLSYIHTKQEDPALVLKETAYEITPMLTHLFQQSLDTGDIPHDWRSARVTLIYKKGQRTDPQNYHPVSFTSIACKTLEHILSSQIMHHLESNDIICTIQFGFRNKNSCESQLLITVDDFAKALNSKKQVDIGILDFSKTFDRVPHARLAKN